MSYLADLQTTAPRMGLGAATGRFVDHLVEFTKRCGSSLFVCFEDPRVPRTSNALEGFFSRAKHMIRAATGAKGTTNSPIRNLGADYLVTFSRVERARARPLLADAVAQKLDLGEFDRERKRLDESEAPSRRRRSIVRNLTDRLRDFGSRLRRLREGRVVRS